MSCCVLDEEKFRQCCQLLLRRSEQLGDGWTWEAVQGSEEGYLKKTAVRSAPTDHSPLQKHEGPGSCLKPDETKLVSAASLDPDSMKDEMVDEDDGSCTVTDGSSPVLQYEYHILHSCSYRSPVMYFRAFTLEGRSLTLEEVWSSVHPNFRLRLQSSPLNAISQQEHPFLGQPFFFLHPCRTEEFVQPVLQEAQDQHRPVNHVLLWLSLVGPVVGLDVPLNYFMDLHPAAPLSDLNPG